MAAMTYWPPWAVSEGGTSVFSYLHNGKVCRLSGERAKLPSTSSSVGILFSGVPHDFWFVIHAHAIAAAVPRPHAHTIVTAGRRPARGPILSSRALALARRPPSLSHTRAVGCKPKPNANPKPEGFYDFLLEWWDESNPWRESFRDGGFAFERTALRCFCGYLCIHFCALALGRAVGGPLRARPTVIASTLHASAVSLLAAYVVARHRRFCSSKGGGSLRALDRKEPDRASFRACMLRPGGGEKKPDRASFARACCAPPTRYLLAFETDYSLWQQLALPLSLSYFAADTCWCASCRRACALSASSFMVFARSRPPDRRGTETSPPGGVRWVVSCARALHLGRGWRAPPGTACRAATGSSSSTTSSCASATTRSARRPARRSPARATRAGSCGSR